MSDGPTRSPQLREKLKKVAESAGDQTVSIENVRDLLVEKLEQEWGQEIPLGVVTSIRNVFEDVTVTDHDERAQNLENFRESAFGMLMRVSFLDFLVRIVRKGECGEEAIQKAAMKTLIDHAEGCKRQIDGWYLAEESPNHAEYVRHRLEDVVKLIDFETLAGRLLGLKN